MGEVEIKFSHQMYTDFDIHIIDETILNITIIPAKRDFFVGDELDQ